MTVSIATNNEDTQVYFDNLKSWGVKKQKYIRKNKKSCKRFYYEHSLIKIHKPWTNEDVGCLDNYVKHNDYDNLESFIPISKNSYSYWY